MDKFDFKEHGRAYVPIYIKPYDKITLSDIAFKVDTGADASTISKADLIILGYDLDWIAKNAVVFKEDDKPSTATGDKVNAGYVQLPLINILGYEAKNWPFQIIIDEDEDFRNLLGRDLLTGFNYDFNNDVDVLTIHRANAFKPRYAFLPNQEISEVLV
jgi:predicted aspartyl protease